LLFFPLIEQPATRTLTASQRTKKRCREYALATQFSAQRVRSKAIVRQPHLSVFVGDYHLAALAGFEVKDRIWKLR
jgi:hypothetical protein